MREQENKKSVANGKKEVAVLLTDMVSYSQKTAQMNPEQIRDFIIQYHQTIQKLICAEEDCSIDIEPSAGDGTIVLFESKPGEGKEEKCRRALSAAITMAQAIEKGQLPDTRMGVFCGDIIEANIGKRVVKFGSIFAVAARLEELCNYFRAPVLMDRVVAKYQDGWQKYLVYVGKVTPKNFDHPINMFTVYHPELIGCSSQAEEKGLLQFIDIKNRAMDYFCGNQLTGIKPDFPLVRELLNKAQRLFLDITGKRDVATDRILEYIRENPYPDQNFFLQGMMINDGKSGGVLGSRLFRLSKQLMKAMDLEFYNALVVDTSWEEKFKIEWWRKGDAIITINEKADGIFYIDSGDVNTLDKDNKVIATLAAGDIFGEMAYFSDEKRRNATVVANSDVVLRRVSSEDFSNMPTIKKIFRRIAQRRGEQQEQQ